MIFFPFLIFFGKDEPGKAFVCMILQGTIFGWPVASYWAYKLCFKKPKEKEDLKG